MGAMPISPARMAAFEILMRIESTNAYAPELLHSGRFRKLSPADHGLLTEILMGTLRWRSLLDQTVAGYFSQPLAKLDLEVLTALRMGAYQLIFLDRVPQRAAIHESVELVKRASKRSAAGLVNAVLRKIGREKPQPTRFDPCSAHPRWLVERWRQHYGWDTVQAICRYDQSTPPPAVRIKDPAVVEEFRQQGIELEPGRLLSYSFTVSASDIARTNAFRERRITLQDEASQLVAILVGHGKFLLDCCAAPGGKTRILAEGNPDANVVALELHPRRAALLKRLVPRPNLRIISADARLLPLAQGFDRILVDAPCSGTGTLSRNPEIKWRLRPEDLERFGIYQTDILDAAMKQVKPGGRLVYSTCSLEPEENEQVIERSLAKEPSFAVLDCRYLLEELKSSGELAWNSLDSLLSGKYVRTIPGVHPCDGFFVAIVERRSARAA
jgi:16S rRNA (cytosine967-C5)-methyltransferase